MSSKNEPPKVINVLERMGMVRKSEDTPAQDSFADSGDYNLEGEVFAEAPAPAETEASSIYEVPRQAEPVANTSWSEPKTYSYDTKSGVGDNMNDSTFWDDSPALSTDTDRFMDIEEIYRAHGMKTGGTDTVYLVEEYMRTLPDSLPAESRRAIIMKIVAASGFDFDRLLNDGIDRVTKLNEYAATFAQQTDKIVARHNTEMDALEKQIQRVRELIGERKNLHKRQFLTIETEAQRLKEVLDFITK